MHIFHAIILGIIEGITEFLPISSTGHMIVASQWLNIPDTASNKAFEVIIQVAAILAVIANYKEKFHPKYFSLWVKVAVAFLPIGIIGFLMSDIVKALFSVTIVGTMFIIGGIIFIWVERFYKEEQCPTTDVNDVTMKQAMWIGFAQIFALIPGTSRAGSTIIGAMLVGLNRKTCAEFSFLLGLPVLAAASGYDLLKHYQDFTSSDFINLAVGFITAFIVAYFVIKWFINFLAKFTFVGFGIYRILFGLLLLGMAWL
ncbi:undecaprenyl-diphosphate phosphatase [Vibrio sp. S11_S32]|uniref:undecaprenyl-diphosphate phosphatase n=1 Tax=Vibrio sp. S11_S32 TaxID=2720225 RepID=UPI0016811146|nr:undecaprenyl-diphosphate phosphatase [Vibrio sp. S11_S32]MBD1575205.1 undecaprenyl-diphosphate phosphatase [Vibrio sp. S11_S32]